MKKGVGIYDSTLMGWYSITITLKSLASFFSGVELAYLLLCLDVLGQEGSYHEENAGEVGIPGQLPGYNNTAVHPDKLWKKTGICFVSL